VATRFEIIKPRPTGCRGCFPFQIPGSEVRAVTITRVGTNQKYAEGWDGAFGGKRGGNSASASAGKKASAANKAPATKVATKKSAKKGKK
jgi:hypothetical protein